MLVHEPEGAGVGGVAPGDLVDDALVEGPLAGRQILDVQLERQPHRREGELVPGQVFDVEPAALLRLGPRARREGRREGGPVEVIILADDRDVEVGERAVDRDFMV